jgi:hypothetical protein
MPPCHGTLSIKFPVTLTRSRMDGQTKRDIYRPQSVHLWPLRSSRVSVWLPLAGSLPGRLAGARTQQEHITSALLLNPDIARCSHRVAKVPIIEVADSFDYLVGLSSGVGGLVRNST